MASSADVPVIDPLSLEYKTVNISGVDCYVMKYTHQPADTLDEKEKQRKRKLKETIGSKSLFTPMLDCKMESTERNIVMQL